MESEAKSTIKEETMEFADFFSAWRTFTVKHVSCPRFKPGIGDGTRTAPVSHMSGADTGFWRTGFEIRRHGPKRRQRSPVSGSGSILPQKIVLN